MRRSIVLVTVAAVVGGLAVTLVRTGNKPVVSREVSDVHRDLATVSAEVAGLKRSLQAQRLANHALQQSLARAIPNVDDDEPIEVEHQPPEPEPELTIKEQVQNLDVRFFEQRPHAEWGRTSTPVAANELKNYLPSDSRLTALECRESMCRAETVHTNVDRYREFMRATATVRKWEGPSIVRINGEVGPGPVKSIMYFAKPGLNLSALAMAEE